MVARVLGSQNRRACVRWNESSKEVDYISAFTETNVRDQTDKMIRGSSTTLHTKSASAEPDGTALEDSESPSDASSSTGSYRAVSLRQGFGDTRSQDYPDQRNTTGRWDSDAFSPAAGKRFTIVACGQHWLISL